MSLPSVHRNGPPAIAHPAIEENQHDEEREGDSLNHGDDRQEVAAGHRPTQRRIFSSTTRRLSGFTR